MATRLTRTALAALVIMLATVFAGCSASTGGMSNRDMGSAPQAPADGGAAPEKAPDGVDRMIIRTQTLRLEVAKTADAIDAVRGLADRHQAIVANMRVASDDGWVYDSPGKSGVALRGWVTLRVPTDSLDAFVKGVLDLGELKFQEETSDDVTQQHVDLSARLENLRAQESRLRELVGQAANVEETLLIEKELWRIRGEIESLDAQIKYLERQAAMATVTVELTEDKPIVRNWGFMDALEDGVRAAAGVFAFLITFLIASLPVLVVGAIVALIIRALRRGRRGVPKKVKTPDAKVKTDESPTAEVAPTP